MMAVLFRPTCISLVCLTSLGVLAGERRAYQPFVFDVSGRHSCQYFLLAARLNTMQRHRLRLRRHQGFRHGTP